MKHHSTSHSSSGSLTASAIPTSIDLSTLPSSTYLEHSQITPYLTDALLTMLSLKTSLTAPSSSSSSDLITPRPLSFLANYFAHVSNPSYNHTAGKNFSFVVATVYNRVTFLHSFLTVTSAMRSAGDPRSGGLSGGDDGDGSNMLRVTPDDFHQLVLFNCPDFIRPIVHTTAWLLNGGKPMASTQPLPLDRLQQGFVIYFYHLDFVLLLLTFFAAAYDGASSTGSPGRGGNGNGGNEKRTIVMPSLTCDVTETPVRELGFVYGVSKGKEGGAAGGSDRPAPNPAYSSLSWRRAFGCSVDVSHISVALKRIEKGCRDCNKPYIPQAVWATSVGMCEDGDGRLEDQAGGEGGNHIGRGTKLTLERLWHNITKNPYFNTIWAKILSGEACVRPGQASSG
jgi:hypothetical protein